MKVRHAVPEALFMEGKITVVGAGISGTALAVFAAEQGAEVFVTDRRGDLA